MASVAFVRNVEASDRLKRDPRYTGSSSRPSMISLYVSSTLGVGSSRVTPREPYSTSRITNSTGKAISVGVIERLARSVGMCMRMSA